MGRKMLSSALAMNLTFLLKSCKLFSDLDSRELDGIQQVAVRKEYRKGLERLASGDERI